MEVLVNLGVDPKSHTHWMFVCLVEDFQSRFVKLVLFYVRLHVVKVLCTWGISTD